jgi:phosphoadenosine phosphosulfate reductase
MASTEPAELAELADLEDVADREDLEDLKALEDLAERANGTLAGASAEEVIRWAVGTTDGRICVTSSMTDAVIIDIASRAAPGIDVIFLDTGYHFAETIGTLDAVAAMYPVTVISVTPAQTVADQDHDLGPRLFERNPDRCCQLRKVEPLERALVSYRGWITGIRRDETAARRGSQLVEWDPRRKMIKVNPIVDWSQDEVDAYITAHRVLVNPLLTQGYPSVGCAPCTRPVRSGGDPRSGRWAGTGKTECGLHTR